MVTRDENTPHESNTPERTPNELGSDGSFDSSIQCRYCYRIVGNDPSSNMSACHCRGVLCKTCLLREMRLTVVQPSGMRCTVCDYHYHQIRKKSKAETQYCSFLSECMKLMCPNLMCSKRDDSVFERYDINEAWEIGSRMILFPKNMGRIIVIGLSIWIMITILTEILGGSVIGDGRVVQFLIDVYLWIEITRVLKYIDFIERKFVSIMLFLRLGLFLYWLIEGLMYNSIEFRKTAMLVTYPLTHHLRHSNDDDDYSKNPIDQESLYPQKTSFYHSWEWLGAWILETLFVLSIEIRMIINDVYRRIQHESTLSEEFHLLCAPLPQSSVSPDTNSAAIEDCSSSQRQNQLLSQMDDPESSSQSDPRELALRIVPRQRRYVGPFTMADISPNQTPESEINN